MCRVCGASVTNYNTSTTNRQPVVQEDCKYSKEFLASLVNIVKDPITLSYITSQVNIYDKNCNLYVNTIEQNLERIGIDVVPGE